MSNSSIDKMLDRARAIRADTLDSFLGYSPGVSQMYNENYFAARKFVEGHGNETMRNGLTVTEYVGRLGAAMGRSGEWYADWILAENRTVTPLASEVEEAYLRLVYVTLPEAADSASRGALLAEFERFCNQRRKRCPNK